MKSWYEKARSVIGDVHKTLPKDASLAERKAALFEAYPFGQRQYHPYKMWCKAQREYLALFGRNAKRSKPVVVVAEDGQLALFTESSP